MTDPKDPVSPETDLAQDIQALRKAAPSMYEELNRRLDSGVQEAVHKFVRDISAIPFQTCVQILLGTEVHHSLNANDVLQVVKRVFFDFGPRDDDKVTVATLQETLNQVLEDYQLHAKVGPYEIIHGRDDSLGRAGVGVRIEAHPRHPEEPYWVEMHFTAFAESTESAWVHLRTRVLNLLGV
jgi:hypothetical protein